MSSVVFLELDDVAALHAESIRRFGGSAGLRDAGLLESALAMPQASMFGEYLHPTLHEQAAAYFFHLVSNHPFIDGNKRTGLAAALTFLGMNGVWVEATNDELIALTLGVAEGRTAKSEVAVFLAAHAIPWD
jgi:death-on-curing protein